MYCSSKHLDIQSHETYPAIEKTVDWLYYSSLEHSDNYDSVTQISEVDDITYAKTVLQARVEYQTQQNVKLTHAIPAKTDINTTKQTSGATALEAQTHANIESLLAAGRQLANSSRANAETVVKLINIDSYRNYYTYRRLPVPANINTKICYESLGIYSNRKPDLNNMVASGEYMFNVFREMTALDKDFTYKLTPIVKFMHSILKTLIPNIYGCMMGKSLESRLSLFVIGGEDQLVIDNTHKNEPTWVAGFQGPLLAVLLSFGEFYQCEHDNTHISVRGPEQINTQAKLYCDKILSNKLDAFSRNLTELRYDD